MKSFSKARIKKGLSKSLQGSYTREARSKHTRGGIGGGHILEPVPGFNEVPSEHVVSTNTMLISSWDVIDQGAG